LHLAKNVIVFIDGCGSIVGPQMQCVKGKNPILIGYLFIAVSEHVPHGVHQKGELWPLLMLLIPALLHHFITGGQNDFLS
jgi:hypothetical protein